MSDEYRTVTFTLKSIGVNVFYIKTKVSDNETLPRSLVHGGDERTLAKQQFSLPKEVTARIMAWKADELHLA